MNIVIAYDGSTHAKAAVDDLRRAGLPDKANVLVVSVGETLPPAPALMSAAAGEDEGEGVMSRRVAGTLGQGRAEAMRATDEASAWAHEGNERVHAHFPHWVVYPEPVAGTPALAVMRKAQDWQADLIVVGSHGRSFIGRFFLGSVSKQVAIESRCSVRVARHVVERGGVPGRIVLGVDGSHNAEAAVHRVASRVWPERTEVRVITVDATMRPSGTWGLLPTAQEWVKGSQDEQVANARAMLEMAVDALRTARLRVSPETRKGRPQDVLIEEARDWGADCIVVGARGFNFLPERFPKMGSVAAALVSHAPCSVEVVR